MGERGIRQSMGGMPKRQTRQGEECGWQTLVGLVFHSSIDRESTLTSQASRVRSVTFFQCEIPAKSFFRPNIISCEKLCCLVMFPRAWKRYLGLITPANPKYDLDSWFHWDCVTVWRRVWLACDLCDATLTYINGISSRAGTSCVMCYHVHTHIRKEFIYLVHENEVFGKHKKILRPQNHISIWHPPRLRSRTNIIWPKKLPNAPVQDVSPQSVTWFDCHRDCELVEGEAAMWFFSFKVRLYILQLKRKIFLEKGADVANEVNYRKVFIVFWDKFYLGLQ